MGKLNVTVLRYLTKEDFRVLTAIEMGMKNHELVPGSLAAQIANLKAGGVHKVLRELCKQKLLSYERGKKYDGYRLTNMGYDYLALKSFALRGTVASFGTQIGVGKESNIYVVGDQEATPLCLKLHRLGRTCFRRIKEKRDYHGKRAKVNWLYLSRISATREYAYLTALHTRGFPVPRPIDFNRHCVLMELVNGYPLTQVNEVANVDDLYDQLMSLIVRLGNCGVIHGDFNEFNIMVTDEGSPILIDFPQMLSTSHVNAKFFFDRDVTGVREYFRKRYGFESTDYPKFEDLDRDDKLDVEVHCTGFTKQMEKDLLQEYGMEEASDSDEDSDSSDVESPKELPEDLIETYRKQVDDEIEESSKKQKKTLPKIDNIRQYIESMAAQMGQLEMIEDDGYLLDDIKIPDVQEPVKLKYEFPNEHEPKLVLLDENVAYSGSEDGDTFDGLEPNSREYRMKMLRKLLDDSRTEMSCSTTASSIAPELVKGRIKKTLGKRDRIDARKRCVAKGEASATSRGRKTNADTVKEYAGWDF